jgi:hypothetical protein
MYIAENDLALRAAELISGASRIGSRAMELKVSLSGTGSNLFPGQKAG